MNIYLASGFRQRDKLRELAAQLQENGHRICSSWIYLDERPTRDSEEWNDFAAKIAATNFVDLLTANVLVVDTNGIAEGNHGGVHTEFGIALGRSMQIYLVGPRGNTFHWLPYIWQVEDYEDLAKHLAKLF